MTRQSSPFFFRSCGWKCPTRPLAGFAGWLPLLGELGLLCFGWLEPVPAQSPQERWAPPGLSQDEVLDGWISLFDGHSLYGWKPVSEGNWRVESGEIRVDGGERGLLRTTAQFDDFEMVLEFKATGQTNSGIFVRTSPEPRNVLADCYEINIASPAFHQFTTGAIVGRAKTELPVAPDQWHHMRILADGAKVKVWVDDEKAVEYLDPQPLGSGYIGLQYNSGPVAFRNVALRPLNQDDLLANNELDQWRQDQALESRFSINDQGELSVRGGRGQLESREQYGDFSLFLNGRTNAAGLNSGLFFRCIRGELMNGYEAQIQHGIVDGDRRQPEDCGTGGIFRRVDARFVNAEDRDWFAMMLVANGPHVSGWVNGIQVTDWTDGRAPDANPRRGRRVAAGTLILQGHDPTTDLTFRKIRARELSPRR